MSDQSVHLAKWMAALEQVWQISIFSERHLRKWHMPALSQVIPQTDYRSSELSFIVYDPSLF